MNKYTRGIKGIVNKCRLKTRVNNLEFQCFYTTVNSMYALN